ncbi:MAG: hypothetical protein JO127_01900 [Caulobacteraceae bacterium]|nr:hypothetical protein [Caulobacteraceae bacterium]
MARWGSAVWAALLLALAFALATPSASQAHAVIHRHHAIGHPGGAAQVVRVAFGHHHRHHHRRLAGAFTAPNAAAAPNVEASRHALAMANLRARAAGVPIAILRVGFDRWLADRGQAAAESPEAVSRVYQQRIAFVGRLVAATPDWSAYYPPVEVVRA